MPPPEKAILLAEFFVAELFDNYFFIIYNASFLAPHAKSVSLKRKGSSVSKPAIGGTVVGQIALIKTNGLQPKL